MLRQPILYLSAYFEANVDAYKDLLLGVSQRGAWRDWIAFFLKGIGVQAREAGARCRALVDLRESYRVRLTGRGHDASLLGIVDQLFDRMAVTMRGLEASLGIPYTTVGRYIDILVREGILTEATGRTRGRVFVAHEILEIVQGRRPVEDDDRSARGHA